MNSPLRKTAILPDPAGVYGLSLFVVFGLFAGEKALADGDTLWHIKVGQYILEHGRILSHDIYSHTAFGKDWMAHEWLSEVVMALLHDQFGFAGMVLVFFLIAALSFILLFRTASRLTGDWAALVAVGAATPLLYSHLLVRPHLFSWLFASLTISLLLRKDRWLWTLPLITALWANLHGGVLLSIVIQGIFLCGQLFDQWPGRSLERWSRWWDDHKRSGIVLLLSLLAIGCNPFGFTPLWLPFYAGSKVFSQEINEWMAPNLQAMWYVRLWLIALIGLAAWYGRKTSWVWFLMAFVMLFQALAHIRHLSIAALAMSPWFAMAVHDLGGLLPRRKQLTVEEDQLNLSPWSGPLITVVLCLLLLIPCQNRSSWWQLLTEDHFKLPDAYSTEALAYLQQNGPPGERLFNEYTWGDYLIYGLDPAPKVFIDGRADMYGEEIFSDYVTLARVQPKMKRILDKYEIDWVLFPKNHILIRHLKLMPEWEEQYRDEQVAILVRREAGK